MSVRCDRLLAGMAARHPPMDRRHIDLRSVRLVHCRLFWFLFEPRVLCHGVFPPCLENL